MKKLLTLFLVATLLLCFTACVDANENSSSEPSSAEESSAAESSTEVTSEDSSEEATDTFQVTVKDQDGNPVVGAMVQICLEVCTPAITNAEGVATFNVEITEGYKLSVSQCPEGYSYTGEAEIYLEDGATEYTLELVKG